MTDYDFRTLSPNDFEILCRDLLQAEMGRRFESFKPGRDQGIDLRAFVDDGHELIVQCKHYLRSGFSKLESNLRLTERPKVVKLKPSRYVIATSVPLNAANKDELVSAVSPYCQGPMDVYGAEDLNNLLDQHHDIERNHYKLWITSTTVLDRLVHADMFQRSNLEREEIEDRLALHVQTNATRMAWEVLDQYNYCIISGIPGIGKTTLAEILVADLISRDYELLVARSNVNEVMSRIGPQGPCVVYYDDFLGQSTFGEKLGKNEEQSLFRLLQMARRHKNVKVILTTREYILADARAEYERLDDDTIDIAKCVIDLEAYTRGDRAEIFYNHLYFYEVPQSEIDVLLSDRRYLEIIDHDNYSPRVIEWVVKLSDRSESTFDQLKHGLDDPTQIWTNVFEIQLSNDARDILLLLGTLSSTTKLDSLRKAFVSSSGGSTREDKIERRFMEALRTLDGTFIATMRDRGEFLVEFANPSIRDFIGMRILESVSIRRMLVEHSVFFEQLKALLGNGSVTPAESFDEIANAVSRLFWSPTDGVHRVYIGRNSSTYRWWSNEIRYGLRARTVLDWTRRLESKLTHKQLLVDLIELCLDDKTISDVGELCHLAEVLLELNCAEEVFDKVKNRLMEEADESTDLTDWKTLADLANANSSKLDRDDFFESAYDAIKSWIDNADYDDPDDRDYDCGNMVEIARIFELDLSAEIETLHNSSINTRWEDNPESRHRTMRPTQTNSRASDSEISDLFASLRR